MGSGSELGKVDNFDSGKWRGSGHGRFSFGFASGADALSVKSLTAAAQSSKAARSFQHLVRGLTDARPHRFGLRRRLRVLGTALAKIARDRRCKQPYAPARPRRLSHRVLRRLGSQTQSLGTALAKIGRARRCKQPLGARTASQAQSQSLKAARLADPRPHGLAGEAYLLYAPFEVGRKWRCDSDRRSAD